MMKEKMKLSGAQMEALQPYERHFRTATQAQWCPALFEKDVKVLLAAWKQLTGKDRIGYRAGCSHCTLSLVTDLGSIYLAQKAAGEAQKAAEAAKPAEPKNDTPKKQPSKKGQKNAK